MVPLDSLSEIPDPFLYVSGLHQYLTYYIPSLTYLSLIRHPSSLSQADCHLARADHSIALPALFFCSTVVADAVLSHVRYYFLVYVRYSLWSLLEKTLQSDI